MDPEDRNIEGGQEEDAEASDNCDAQMGSPQHRQFSNFEATPGRPLSGTAPRIGATMTAQNPLSNRTHQGDKHRRGAPTTEREELNSKGSSMEKVSERRADEPQEQLRSKCRRADELEDELKRERRRADTWKVEAEQNHAEIDQLRRAQEQMKNELRGIQEQVFSRFNSPEWAPRSNEDIERALQSLDSDVKKWAKEYSIPSLQDLMQQRPNTFLEHLTDALGEVMNPIQTEHVKPWVLLESCVMHNIYFGVFDKPFFGINEEVSRTNRAETDGGSEPQENSDRESDRLDGELELLYAMFCERDKQEAVAWRVQTLRQLRPRLPKPIQSSKRGEETSRLTIPGRKKAVKALRTRILVSGLQLLLLHPEKPEVQEPLESFIQRAAALSYSLWTQKIDLEVKHFQSLGPVFSSQNPYLEAHGLHNRDLNDDPASLDQQRILLLAHPALIRRGDLDGSDLTTERVLKKAICWMGKRDSRLEKMKK